MQYTKKPITIEALVWTGENHREMFNFLGGDPNEHMESFNENFHILHSEKLPGGLIIKTLEGHMSANIGDYIIKGVKGEYYPCKPDIFEMSYNLAGDKSPLQHLAALQNHYGYVKGEIDPVALLGLFGEAGEVIGETKLIDITNDLIKADDLKQLAVNSAKQLDDFKKVLRKKQAVINVITSEPPQAFNTELADCFYYVHALAINRGLTIEDLAQISLDKIKAKEAQNEALG